MHPEVACLGLCCSVTLQQVRHSSCCSVSTYTVSNRRCYRCCGSQHSCQAPAVMVCQALLSAYCACHCIYLHSPVAGLCCVVECRCNAPPATWVCTTTSVHMHAASGQPPAPSGACTLVGMFCICWPMAVHGVVACECQPADHYVHVWQGLRLEACCPVAAPAVLHDAGTTSASSLGFAQQVVAGTLPCAVVCILWSRKGV
jgi:hypothetical protein